MAWTKEQQQAIDLEGKNIIVSAGAGSGKTAVLTARVQRKLLSGIHIYELLVLTFTNAAAQEMKERIRNTIRKTPELSEEARYIDGSYITTFDAFSLAMVKKYHIRLNITSQIQVSDEIMIALEKRRILDEIMEKHYLSPKQNFMNLVHDFCFKDDQELKDALLKMYDKIQLKYDKRAYLDSYLASWNEEKINCFLQEYLSLIQKKQAMIQELFPSLNDWFDGDFVSKMRDNFVSLLNAKSYEDFLKGIEYKSLTVPRGSEEEGKTLKKTIYTIADEIKDLCIYSSLEEMREELLSTKSNVEAIVELLQEFDKRLDDYKNSHELYTFTDISRMAIQVVMENSDIREELTNQFQEILVDEYQDTSDTQEMFLSLISKNNIYMVGDIKQSIYRFRNANPYIFKEKYDSYRDTDLGEKIDLLRNFRSRREVLDNINLLFDLFMDDDLGGADYRTSHRMVFGNDSYIKEGLTEQNYNMDVLVYDKNSLGRLSTSEEEAFLIGYDIIDKVKKHYPIFDKDKKILRDIQYRDFVILLDKSRDFDLYKKIFEYLHIPLTILKDESLKKENDILIFKSLFQLLICMKREDYSETFQYAFTSVARSFLCSMKDSEIYECIVKKQFFSSSLFQTCSSLLEYLDTTNLSQFFLKIIDTFHYEEKLLTIGNIHYYEVRLEYLYQLCQNYECMGKTIYDFAKYLGEIFDTDLDLKFHVSQTESDSCRIMTIHKSKGLEFPICYFAGLSSRFNMSDLKERIIYDSTYGIILPKVEEFYKDTILKTLLKNKIHMEEISEKIRLFYVALTRAKEKMIFVLPKLEEEKEVLNKVPLYERENYVSFLSIIKSVYSVLLPYVQEREIVGSKNYLISESKSIDYSKTKKIPVCEIEIEA